MGFDNECILNIQSLAGEYFCPVCRLLVYPHEAMQSQCTHLYCKPCLTYVVSTTSACPYDGYLVTEADAKPLLESNKALADTIGKIEIHCLYHRSGCTWQGPLSECTSHCSGCAFGNSPVVCNRCGIQIVHREVQEHAQNCPGVQSQAQQAGGAQDAAVTGTTSATDQNQTATQVGAVSSQAQTSQSTATVVPGKDGSQQANSNPQASVPTPDQWYQQQQQYQQYYQQFPGYDPYQQQYQMYYPYQQPAAPQYQQQQQQLQTHPSQSGQQQPPMQVQPPPAPSQPLAQVPTSAPPQNQIQANPPQQNHPAVQPYSQMQSQAPPPPHPHPYPQTQPNQNPQHVQPQYQHPQMPQYQQTHPQMQPQQSQPPRYPPPPPQPQPHPQAQPPVQLQNHPQPQPQPHQAPAQNPSAHAITGHHSYPQPQLQQQMQPGAAHQHSMHMQSQAGPYRPPQHPVQMQSQFSQHPPQMRPPLSHAPIQNVPPVQQQPIYPHAQQPGHAIHQRPVTQAVQQPMPQQYVQQPQPFVGQPSVSVQNQLNQQGPFTQQQLPMQPQIRPQAPAQQLHAYPQPHQNFAMPHGVQAHQSHFVGGRPTIPNEGVQSQSYAQSAGVEVRPTHQSANQHSTSQVKLSTEQLKPAIPADQESKSPAQQMAKKGANEFDGRSYPKVDAGEKIPMKSETDMKNGDEPKSVSEVDEKTRVGTAKEIQEPMKTVDIDVKSKQLENREPVIKQEVNEANLSNLDMPNDGKSGEIMAIENKGLENNDLNDGSGLKKYSSLQGTEPSEEQHGKLAQTPGTQGHGLDEYGGLTAPGQGRHLPSFQHHRPGAPFSHFPPSQHHTAAPGHTSNQFRPQGSLPGTEVPPSVISGPGSTASFGRGPSHYGPHGPHIQGHMHPSHAGALRPSQGDPFMGPPPPGTSEYDSHAGMMAKPPPHGRQHPANFEQGAFGVHTNMTRINGAPGLDSSLPHGVRDERFKPPTDDHMNPFPADPSRHIMDHGEFEDDKRFPRHSLDAEPVPKSGSYFSSSRPVDMGSIMRSESTRGRPDFLRPVPGYGGHHMDGFPSRSPPRDYPGISPHGFGGLTGIPGSRPGLEEVDGRHRFGDPYNDGRFRGLPGHMHRGEFEGTGNSRMGEHLRSGDLIDRNFLPSHLRRGEHFGPRHMLEEPAGYDHFPGHVQRGELGAPGGNFSHHLPPSKSFGGGRPNQRPDEPGFRSNFSLQGYPHDGGMYTGDMDPFDNLRKRKPANMGWCRICKVDCETVEGLDLHAQTREHQKNAMDMVLTIKQNAKKQKSISRDPSSFEDANKSRNANFGSRGNMR